MALQDGEDVFSILLRQIECRTLKHYVILTFQCVVCVRSQAVWQLLLPQRVNARRWEFKGEIHQFFIKLMNLQNGTRFPCPTNTLSQRNATLMHDKKCFIYFMHRSIDRGIRRYMKLLCSTHLVHSDCLWVNLVINASLVKCTCVRCQSETQRARNWVVLVKYVQHQTLRLSNDVLTRLWFLYIHILRIASIFPQNFTEKREWEGAEEEEEEWNQQQQQTHKNKIRFWFYLPMRLLTA